MNARIEKYLIGYSFVQLFAWLTAFIFINVDHVVSFEIILIFQIISLVETFHAYKKWNNSSPIFSFIQTAARLFILFLIYSLISKFMFRHVNYYKEVVTIMLHVWCFAEIIRYAHYLTQLLKKENKIISWLRYSAFLILYPIGVACEFFIMYLVFINNNFGLKIILIVIAIAYIFLFPRLYLHLLKQRKLKLNSNNK